MTTGVATAEGATRSPQIGSFSVVERVSRPDAPQGQVTLRVTGLDGKSFSGQGGIATCIAAPRDEAARAVVAGLAEKLSSLRHAALIPVLEANVSGNVAWWVSPVEIGQSLPELAPHAPVPVSTVVAITAAVAAGLQAAHDAGLSHGSLTTAAITSPRPGAYAVAGVGLNGKGPAEDQRALGEIVISLLSGRAWHEVDTAEPLSVEERLVRAQRLRDWLSGLTERVVNVVLKATEPNPADRFGSVTEFAESLAVAVRHSAEDLVQAAFEAISGRTVDLARLLAVKAARYDPSSEGLALLNLQLQGGSPFEAAPMGLQPSPAELVASASAATQAPMAAPVMSQSALSPELAQGLPPEFLEMIAPQFQVTNPKRGMNPMFVLAIGGAGVLLLMLVAALATFFLSNS